MKLVKTRKKRNKRKTTKLQRSISFVPKENYIELCVYIRHLSKPYSIFQIVKYLHQMQECVRLGGKTTDRIDSQIYLEKILSLGSR